MPQVVTRFPEPALDQKPRPRRPIPEDQLPVIVSTVRTPIGKFLGAFADLPSPVLGGVAIKEAVKRARLKAEDVDEVFMGCVLTAGVGQKIRLRQAALKAGLPSTVSALTINKVCASGLTSVVLACQAIISGDIEVAVAGGMENMSRAPYLLDRARTGYRLGHGQILDSMISDGLWCAMNDFHMGETGELVSEYYGISRTQQDEYALNSQKKAVAAVEAGRFNPEIVPVPVPSRKGEVLIDKDEGPRADTTPESLAKLKPAFKQDGTVTAGNASTINDGAAALVIMSPARAKQMGLKPLARILDYYTAGLDPAWVMMTPVPAVRCLVGRNAGWKMSDFDLFEVNEAFSVQALAVQRELALKDEQINVNGGAVALGHPIGASGARILVTLVNGMHQKGAERGIATLCLGGGNGVALAVQTLAVMDDDEVDVLGENIDAAAMVSRWRQRAAGGLSFKFKWEGEPLPPALQTGDVVEMTGPTAFELRKGDMICYQQGNDLLMRRVQRYVHSDGRNAYVVRSASDKDEAILHSQIVGKIVVIERTHQRIVIDRERERKRLLRLGQAQKSDLSERAQRHVDNFHFWLDRFKRRFGK